MKAYVAQWIGKREKQEDSYAVKYYPDGVLLVVCDGMGGHHHGAMASRTAADAFVADFDESAAEGMPVVERLRQALDMANAAVGRQFCKCESYGGTTLVAAYISGGLLWWVSVGDSPLFLWRRRRLARLNEDHSLRAIFLQYVQAGSLSYDEAMQQGHRLRSALTGEQPSLVDAPATPYPLLPGDRIILASDGADDLLLPAIMPDSVKDLLDCRERPLPALVVEACMKREDAQQDNLTIVSVDWC